MGLGLFIAKTLLERTGARLGFANGTEPFSANPAQPTRSGAVVTVTWPIQRLAPPEAGPLGENQPFVI